MAGFQVFTEGTYYEVEDDVTYVYALLDGFGNVYTRENERAFIVSRITEVEENLLSSAKMITERTMNDNKTDDLTQREALRRALPYFVALFLLLIVFLLGMGATYLIRANRWREPYVTLTGVFGLYLANIYLFAFKYYSVYKRDPDAFLFNEQISRKKARGLKERYEKFIADSEIVIIALKELSQQFQGQEGNGLNWGPILIKRNQPYKYETANYEFIYRLPAVRSKHFTRALDLHVHTKDGECLTVIHGLLDAPEPDECIRDLVTDIEQCKKNLESLASSKSGIWFYTDFIYFSTMTQTTAGYGDIVPNSPQVRRLVMYQIMMGVIIGMIVLNFILLKT